LATFFEDNGLLKRRGSRSIACFSTECFSVASVEFYRQNLKASCTEFCIAAASWIRYNLENLVHQTRGGIIAGRAVQLPRTQIISVRKFFSSY